MKQRYKDIVWFREVGKWDIGAVGGKGSNLGEMTNADIPVPPGFIVTAGAYHIGHERPEKGVARQYRDQQSHKHRCYKDNIGCDAEDPGTFLRNHLIFAKELPHVTVRLEYARSSFGLDNLLQTIQYPDG